MEQIELERPSVVHVPAVGVLSPNDQASPTNNRGSALHWRREDTLRTSGLLGLVAAIHVLAWGVFSILVLPHQYQVGTQVFGLGLGITAYTLGMRHAFDADHIAAIDNTTRKLMADGKRPHSVGFWFALGHSAVVVIMASLVAAGAHVATTLADDSSSTHQVLSLVSTSASSSFLYLIGLLNLAALFGMVRIFVRMRRGRFDEAALESALNSRGLLTRLLSTVTKSITRPGQMFAVGLMFGLGFDTATEVTLLVLAGSSAASGLPWYAVLVLPLLFAAGMTLFDTLDGTFMHFAYNWAFANPIRKVFYNVTITGLSVVVALVIGTIELVSVLHSNLDIQGPLFDWIAGLNLNNMGFILVGLFVAVWTIALSYWHLAHVERGWASSADASCANR